MGWSTYWVSEDERVAIFLGNKVTVDGDEFEEIEKLQELTLENEDKLDEIMERKYSELTVRDLGLLTQIVEKAWRVGHTSPQYLAAILLSEHKGRLVDDCNEEEFGKLKKKGCVFIECD